MRSFTLIETLITVVIFALALGAVIGFVITAYKTQAYAFQQAQAILEARKGVETMIKEIREARVGDDGAYIIEKADDYEFIFYSDIDKDNQIERVRYFIKPAGGGSGSQTKECVSFSNGGSCNVTFADFLTGNLKSAQVKVSVEGDLNTGSETVEIFADGVSLGTLCTGNDCGQCAGGWQDSTTFDVTNLASDNLIQLTADSSWSVGAFCDWQEPNHSVKAKFEFTWEKAATPQEKTIFKKGVTDPQGWPISYSPENEQVFIISENVLNETSKIKVFTYYNQNNELLPPPARLEETSLMHLQLIINVDPGRPPKDFSLESDVQIRNLKTNL